VSDDYIRFCLDKTNAKLEENFSRIDKFEERLTASLLPVATRPSAEVKVAHNKRTRREDRVIENAVEASVTVEEDSWDIFEDFSLNQNL
jgi:hypothetical protein